VTARKTPSAPSHVRVELVDDDTRLRDPYRETVTNRARLRLVVSIA
jgi:hypothetical protein